MVEDVPLFDVAPVSQPAPSPRPKLSATRRRTQRQAEHLAAGLHPLSVALRVLIKLHPDAPSATDRTAAGPRCGACRFRVVQFGRPTSRAYPKCSYDKERGWPRASGGAGTDVRAWWPACADYQPEEG
ncbi:hypothetical protein AB0425_17815 [Actinosynnema sp. NPDC051121]